MIAVATAGMVLDSERLFWVPGARTVFVPPVSAWPVGGGLTFSRRTAQQYAAAWSDRC